MCLNYRNEDIEELLVTETYSGNSTILGVNSHTSFYKSKFIKNPIVIMDNTKHSVTNRYLNELYFATEILYRIPQSDFDKFIEDNEMGNEIIKITNAKDLYYYNRSAIERHLKLMSAISLFIVLLEVEMIVFTVRLEYTVNGVEMSVKKILGYGVLAREKQLILIPSIIVPICTVSAVIIAHIFNVGNPLYVLSSGIVLLAAEILFVFSQCVRMDKIRTSLILKGTKL